MDEQFPEFWEEFALATANNLKNSHAYITSVVAQKIPTYIIRYEDLMLDPESVLTELFMFLFDIESIHGTVIK